MDPFSLLAQQLSIGFFTRTSKAENNSAKQPHDNNPENSARTLKPEKRRKKKPTKTSDCMKFLFSEIDEIIENPESYGPAVVIYIRVSSWLQVFGGKSLEFQKKELLKLAKQIGASRIYIISDEGKSGRNFSNRKLGTILQLAAAGKITRLLVSEIDRAGRDAFELLFYLFELRRFGVIIQTPKEQLDLKKLVDLIILAVKSVAAEEQVVLRGAGSMRTKRGNFLKGEWNLPVPLGYKSKGLWITQVPEWKPVIRAIFTLFLELKNYGSVCRAVNSLHRDFLLSNLKKFLKPSQIKRILTNPVYVGKPRLSSAVKEDPSLAMVNPATFQEAQRIINLKNKLYKRREKPIDEVFKFLGSEALTCFPHVVVPCPICRTKMDSNGSLGYICPKCGRHRTDVKKSEVVALRDYLIVREQILELAVKLSKKYKWTGLDGKKWKKLENLLKEIRGRENVSRDSC